MLGFNRHRVPRCYSDIEGAEVRESPEHVDRAKRLDVGLKFGRGSFSEEYPARDASDE